jgi:hypothetical protein
MHKLGTVVDQILIGKGAYESFRCSECHWWDDIAGTEHGGLPMQWGICKFRHDRMYANIPEPVNGGNAELWTHPGFACVEFTVPGFGSDEFAASGIPVRRDGEAGEAAPVAESNGNPPQERPSGKSHPDATPTPPMKQ